VIFIYILVQNEFHPNSKFENKINSSPQSSYKLYIVLTRFLNRLTICSIIIERKNNSTPFYSNEMFRSSQTEMNFGNYFYIFY